MGPIIKIEVEGIRERVAQMLVLHGNEYDHLIKESVARCINPENIQNKVDMAVGRIVDEAIKRLSDNYDLRTCIEEEISKMVISNVKAKND